jgi:hypothetical protein
MCSTGCRYLASQPMADTIIDTKAAWQLQISAADRDLRGKEALGVLGCVAFRALLSVGTSSIRSRIPAGCARERHQPRLSGHGKYNSGTILLGKNGSRSFLMRLNISVAATRRGSAKYNPFHCAVGEQMYETHSAASVIPDPVPPPAPRNGLVAWRRAARARSTAAGRRTRWQIRLVDPHRFVPNFDSQSQCACSAASATLARCGIQSGSAPLANGPNCWLSTRRPGDARFRAGRRGLVSWQLQCADRARARRLRGVAAPG